MVKIKHTMAVVAVMASALLLAGCTSGTSGNSTAAPKATVSFAFSSAVPQIEKVPTLQAMAGLKSKGYPTKSIWLQSSADPVQAVVRGDATFGSASTSAVLAAIAQGVPVIGVMSALNPAYAIEASSSISGPSAMNGKRLAINATVSSTTLYGQLMVNNLPGVKPQLLVIPGTPARVSALIAGQADAAVLQLSAVPDLEKQQPGKFHTIYNVASSQQGLSDSMIFVRTDELKNHRDFVKTVVDAIVAQQADAYSNTAALGAAITKYIPSTDVATGKAMAKLYTTSKAWPADGGFTKADVQKTLDRLATAKLVSPIPTVKQSADLTLVP
jgi:NitT/TauT family transport system substrate-binding protein